MTEENKEDNEVDPPTFNLDSTRPTHSSMAVKNAKWETLSGGKMEDVISSVTELPPKPKPPPSKRKLHKKLSVGSDMLMCASSSSSSPAARGDSPSSRSASPIDFRLVVEKNHDFGSCVQVRRTSRRASSCVACQGRPLLLPSKSASTSTSDLLTRNDSGCVLLSQTSSLGTSGAGPQAVGQLSTLTSFDYQNRSNQEEWSTVLKYKLEQVSLEAAAVQHVPSEDNRTISPLPTISPANKCIPFILEPDNVHDQPETSSSPSPRLPSQQQQQQQQSTTSKRMWVSSVRKVRTIVSSFKPSSKKRSSTTTTDSNLTLDSVRSYEEKGGLRVASPWTREPSPNSPNRKSPKDKSPRVHKHKKIKGLLGKLKKCHNSAGGRTLDKPKEEVEGDQNCFLNEFPAKSDVLHNHVQHSKALSKVMCLLLPSVSIDDSACKLLVPAKYWNLKA